MAKFQVTLEGKKSPEGLCCSACLNAQYEKCVCRCGGEFHGMLNPNYKPTEKQKKARIRKRLHEEIAHYGIKEGAQKYKPLLVEKECRWCGADLSEEPILAYEHDAGWPVEGEDGLWWLWIKCPGCGYDWAIWKLGVPRDAKA